MILVWLQFSSPAVDTVLEVLASNNLNPIDCNDDSCNAQSSVSFAATRGVKYYVRVGGYSGAKGNFALNVALRGMYAPK